MKQNMNLPTFTLLMQCEHSHADLVNSNLCHMFNRFYVFDEISLEIEVC